ncbi:MAG: hypothetical protein E6845_07675 [Clostridium sp.]|uniref:hypothetical protein n=1 Tax=Clostridium sp. TaxID=1506 RepID=UPI0028FE7080|nr:hypothetical protein [Clostridium sp.]MDU1602830.1 hypothetical protein [Clostridium sp.]
MKGKREFKSEGFISINDSFKRYRKDRADITDIHKILKEEYMQKLEKNELDFALERAYIRAKTGWDINDNEKLVISSVLALGTGIILFTFQQNVKMINDIGTSIWTFLLDASMILTVIFIINRKTILRSYNEKIYFKMRLDILNELEKKNK